MTTIRQLLHTAAILATIQVLSAAVPGTINYQGRLPDAAGVPQPGTKAMDLKIFDAATGGSQLYTETIGNVTADANGVYGFQFGASGTSNTLVTETLATTDGTATTFQKVLANSPVVADSVGVTDGTYSWNQSTGSSNEDEFGAAYSTSLRRLTVNYYSGPPAAGQTITVTYRYADSGIAGALAAGSEQWLELTVEGVAQMPRQKVLAVPFAMTAERASVATRLETSIKTCQLVVLTPTSPSTTVNSSSPQATTRRNLPASVSPNDRGNGTSDSFYRTIDSAFSIIHSISSNALVSNSATQYYPPLATIELVAYTNTGARIVVSSQTRITSGKISLVGPISLDHTQNQYMLECGIYTGGNSAGQANTTTTLMPIEIEYEH